MSDEVYSHVAFDMKNYRSLAQYYPEGTIVTGGISKYGNAGGWRLGFAALPDELSDWVKSINAVLSETTSCAPTPVQKAAVHLFDPNPPPETVAYFDDMRRALKATGEYTARRLRGMGALCHDPDGGFYVMPDFSPYADKFKAKGVTTNAEFVKQLLLEQEVSVLAGTHFLRPDDELSLRLSYVDFDGEAVLRAARSSSRKELGEAFVREHCPNVVEGMDRMEKFINDY